MFESEQKVADVIAYKARVWRGAVGWADASGDIDDLHRRVRVPVTARRVWMDCWLKENPSYVPLIIGVTQGEHLDGVACLAMRRMAFHTRIVGIGHGSSDYMELPTTGAGAATALSDAIFDQLSLIRGGWALEVRQIDEDLPGVFVQLGALLPVNEIVPGMPSPITRLNDGATAKDFESRSTRKTIANALARLRREQRVWTVDQYSITDEVKGQSRTALRIKRRRDLHARGSSPVSSKYEYEAWEELVRGHADAGSVKLFLGRVDGVAAAYAVCFIEDAFFRIWDLRYEPTFGAYSPGRLLAHKILEVALLNPAVEVVDWMAGDEPYKLSISNERIEPAIFRAWSSSSMRFVALKVENFIKSSRKLFWRVQAKAYSSKWLHRRVS